MTSLGVVLESSLEMTVIGAALLGVLCHQAIRPFEVDNRGWEMLLSYLTVAIGVLVGYLVSDDFDLADAILRTLWAAISFLAGLCGSMVIYRALFHRLSRFPGPFAARLSNLYHFVFMARTNMQYHLHVQKLHARYGDFVRTGPRELTVTRASAIELLYGPSSKCTKGTWYDQNSGNPDKVGIENIRDKETHRIRRKPWDRAFGFRALATYQGRVTAKMDRLMQRVGTGKPFNMTQESTFYAWDVMGDLAFSEDFRMLQTGVEHPAVGGLHWALATAGIITTLPWLMNMLRVLPGATGKFEGFASWCYQQVDRKKETLAHEMATNKSYEPQDVMSWIIKAYLQRDRSAPPTQAAIREDARTLISAGSDPVSIAFTNIAYFMVTHPDAYKKLQRLVEAEFPGGYKDWTYDRAKGIPHVDYFIHEAIRLRPPVPMGFLRQTPKEGLQVDDVFIPGNVNVNVPTWTLHRDGRYFERPDEFVPERWEELSTEKAAYLPFQRGSFACVGKSLAMMQMRMFVSCVALRYNVSFAPDEDGRVFWRDAKETLTMWIPPLQMVFTPK